MENKGYTGFNLKELISKVKKLRQKYKFEKDKTKRTGTARQKKWKFFDEMDAILTHRHNVSPSKIVDTLAENNPGIYVTFNKYAHSFIQS